MGKYLSSKAWKTLLSHKDCKGLKEPELERLITQFEACAKSGDATTAESLMGKLTVKLRNLKKANAKNRTLVKWIDEAGAEAESTIAALTAQLEVTADGTEDRNATAEPEKQPEPTTAVSQDAPNVSDTKRAQLGEMLAAELTLARRRSRDKALKFVVNIDAKTPGLMLTRKEMTPAIVKTAMHLTGKKGKLLQGLCYGSGGKWIFEFVAEPPEVLIRVLKKAALMHADMNLKLKIIGGGVEFDDGEAPNVEEMPSERSDTDQRIPSDDSEYLKKRLAATARDIKALLVGDNDAVARLAADVAKAAAALKGDDVGTAEATLATLEDQLANFRDAPVADSGAREFMRTKFGDYADYGDWLDVHGGFAALDVDGCLTAWEGLKQRREQAFQDATTGDKVGELKAAAGRLRDFTEKWPNDAVDDLKQLAKEVEILEQKLLTPGEDIVEAMNQHRDARNDWRDQLNTQIDELKKRLWALQDNLDELKINKLKEANALKRSKKLEDSDEEVVRLKADFDTRIQEEKAEKATNKAAKKTAEDELVRIEQEWKAYKKEKKAVIDQIREARTRLDEANERNKDFFSERMADVTFRSDDMKILLPILDSLQENPEYDNVSAKLTKLKGFAAELDPGPPSEPCLAVLAELEQLLFTWCDRRSAANLPPNFDAWALADFQQTLNRKLVRAALDRDGDAPVSKTHALGDIGDEDERGEEGQKFDEIWIELKCAFAGKSNVIEFGREDDDFRGEILAEMTRLMSSSAGRKLLHKLLCPDQYPPGDPNHVSKPENNKITFESEERSTASSPRANPVRDTGLQNRLERGKSKKVSAKMLGQDDVHDDTSLKEAKGLGSASIVTYPNGNRDSDSPLGSATGNHILTPSFVTLAHELIHVLHNRRGADRGARMQLGSDKIRGHQYEYNAVDDAVHDNWEERWTIEGGKTSENVIRDAHGLKTPRYGHGGPDPYKGPAVVQASLERVEHVAKDVLS